MFFRALTFAGFRGGFQHRPRNPANVNARKKHVRSLLLHKSIEKVDFRAVFRCIILALFCFDFLHRRTKIISIYILVPGPSVNNYSIMAENWQGFTTRWQSLQKVVVVCLLF